LSSGATVTLRILASEILLARNAPDRISARNVLRGRVIAILGHGDEALVKVRAGADWFVVVSGGLMVLTNISSIFGYLVMLFWLAFIGPAIAVSCRRMHDVDKSGWFQLIPIYNLILACTEGTSGPNQYGPDPKVE
jgi:hypothetical protein